MNAPLAPAHSPLGGSVAARVLGCPASVGLVQKVPAQLRRPSAYAERGIALHAAMAFLINKARSLDSLAGATINSYTLTRADVESALRPVYTYVTALLNEPGAEFRLEQRVTFPSIPDAFGTLDLLVRIGSTAHLIDVKFGLGVPVRAFYPGSNKGVVNTQLQFYAVAARHSLPEFFAGAENIVLTILQPVPDAGMVSSATVTHAELDEFVSVYRTACEEALSPSPRLQRGPWCRFCPARPICPAHTKLLPDLAQFTAPLMKKAPRLCV